MDPHPGHPLPPAAALDLLDEARRRTLLLVAPLSAQDLRSQHSPLMSPIVWDLGHIAHFEEVWLLKNLQGGDFASEGLEGMYDPFRNPRATRDTLPLPDRGAALGYLEAVRERVRTFLPSVDPRDSDHPLLEDSFVVRMVLQHEYQHNETILQTLQLKGGEPYHPPERRVPPAGREPGSPDPGRTEPGSPEPGGQVRFPGASVEVGTDDRSAAYDNERPAHRVELPAFAIDRFPVTNGQFLAFMEAGGYDDPGPWTPEGWAWLQEAGHSAPRYWFPSEDGAWWTRQMDREFPVPLDHPVVHVTYWEADAYARWAGKRLPTEFEWEAAARWDPETGESRRFPWGEEEPDVHRANLDQLAFGTTPVEAHPGGVSPLGCWDMIGNVWEWTATDFHPYPGYRTFPYPEYSEVFFGDEYKVLRGGSWATRPGAIRTTFRNWDYPIRSQIFAGFRCASHV